MKTAPRQALLTVLLPLAAALGAVFIALPVHADIVPQTDPFAVVQTGDANVTWYMGTSTTQASLTSVGLWLAEPTAVGSATYIRITCFANTWSASQSGCTDTSAHQSDTISVYSTTGQPYYFSFSSPVVLQSGKVYVMEIVSVSPYVSVYGTTSYQFAGQCDYAALGTVDCTGTPYFTTNSLPDWSGINATSTALTALYQAGASSTLGIIQARCTGTGGGIFGEAMCATFAFLFVPDPMILNGYSALTTGVLPTKFPFAWFYGVKDAIGGISASSTANMASVSIAFNAIDPATSTAMGPILPNLTLLSSTTITQYMPQGFLTLILLLEAAALWILFAYRLYYDIPKWLHS